MILLGLDYIEVADIADMAEAVKLGTGRARMPRSWLELLTEGDKEGMEEWRTAEFQSEPSEV